MLCDLDIELKQITHRISTFMCDLDIEFKQTTHRISTNVTLTLNSNKPPTEFPHKCDLDIQLKQTTHRISTFMCDLDIQLKPPTELNSQQIRVIDLWLYPAWKVAYLSCGTWIDTRIHILVLLPHHGLLLFVKWHVRQVHVIIPTRH